MEHPRAGSDREGTAVAGCIEQTTGTDRKGSHAQVQGDACQGGE